MKENMLKVNPRLFHRGTQNTEDTPLKVEPENKIHVNQHAGINKTKESLSAKEDALKELYVEIDINNLNGKSKTANFFWGDNETEKLKGNSYLSIKDVEEEWTSYTYFDISKLVGQSRPRVINLIKKTKPAGDFVLNKVKHYLPVKKEKNESINQDSSIKSKNSPYYLRGKFNFINSFGSYAKSICFGVLALFSVFSVFSFLHHPENAPDTVSMIMGQNMESKLETFQHSLLKGEIVDDKRQELVYYVSKGENISDLALKFHLKESTIRNANKIPTAVKKTRVGQKLVILPVDGVLHPIRAGETIDEIARRYKVSGTKIVNANNLNNPELIRINQQVIIPGATNIKFRPKPKLSNIAKIVNSQSSFRVSYIPGMIRGVSRYLDSGRTCWPANGSITSVYGWRWGSFHTGIDIANNYGTSIRSIRSGVVIGTGYEGGYGNMITVDHGNGMVTRYAHCSSISVSYGQRVMAGQVIGAMGSTGYSTGPHVHFEVMLNGTHVNPRAYF